MKRAMAVAAMVAGVTAWGQQPRVIRSMGDKEMQPTMARWEAAYSRVHPEVRFEDKLIGSATGMAGIITGISDVTLLGRPVTANEVIGFEWVHRVKPLGIEVARGPLHGEGKSPALVVAESRENPVRAVTMKQLAEVLGCPADGAQAVTWGMLGATGAWASRPVHAYVYDDQTGTGAFLQQAVQGAKDCWNWSMVKEFKDEPGRPAAQQIAEALQRDSDGLAVTTMEFARSAGRVVAVDGVKPEGKTVSDGSYALGRGVYAYVNPKTVLTDEAVMGFLRFCMSAEGQRIVAAQGDFLPLDAATSEKELAKLK